jgi:hypothetical protein
MTGGAQAAGQAMPTAVVLHDYAAANHQELSMRSGDVRALLSLLLLLSVWFIIQWFWLHLTICADCDGVAQVSKWLVGWGVAWAEGHLPIHIRERHAGPATQPDPLAPT